MASETPAHAYVVLIWPPLCHAATHERMVEGESGIGDGKRQIKGPTAESAGVRAENKDGLDEEGPGGHPATQPYASRSGLFGGRTRRGCGARVRQSPQGNAPKTCNASRRPPTPSAGISSTRHSSGPSLMRRSTNDKALRTHSSLGTCYERARTFRLARGGFGEPKRRPAIRIGSL
jgi:hypothetical protein